MTSYRTEGRSLRILFVAQAVSIHTARWISQLREQAWDIHLFDMLGSFPHAELSGVTEYSLILPRRIASRNGNPPYGSPFFLSRGWDPFPLSLVGFFSRRLFKNRVRRLANLIRELRPDVIHSMELQTESYHLLEVSRILGGELGAPWMVTTWGSDLFYFQRFPKHLGLIKQILQRCNYLIPDCQRDVALARELGFEGQVPLILPGSGGYAIDSMRRAMIPGAPSSRKTLVLKGYEGWAGRALTAIAALESCASLLANFQIVVYGASAGVTRRLRELQLRTGLRTTILPRSPHATMLELFGRSRIALAVNITDGVPNAMLEAMTMGAFPIQSDTQSTAEWITHGVNGLLVDPEDPESISAAIRRAIEDPKLVDSAAAHNAQLIAQRLDLETVRPRVIDMYRTVADRWNRCHA